MMTVTPRLTSGIASVRADFDDRVGEIDNYFRFILDLDNSSLTIIPDLEKSGVALTIHESDLLVKTLKANCFLLLYNLMEATTKNAIQAIFDEFKSKGVSYDSCRLEVKRVAVKNLKRDKIGIDDLCLRLSAVAQDIVTESFDKDSVVSGNVDARKIVELADEYGFAHPKWDGRKLLEVKANRNSLAHGNMTFNDIGKDCVASELVAVKEQVKKYLSEFLINIDLYLRDQLYLATPPTLTVTPTVTSAIGGIVTP